MVSDAVLKSLSLKEKLFQMFILGFSGENLGNHNLNIQDSIKKGLGGVILFTENISSYKQASKLSENLQKTASIPLFISIDQEGGCVERTQNIPEKKIYLSPGELVKTKNPDFTRGQTAIMAKELSSIGINMNFAPVMDVNTNPKNPIIGFRAYGSNSDSVISFAREVYREFSANSIIPVVKHFPGHGDTGEDSHQTMPVVNLNMEQLENQHISPFKTAIKDNIDLIMVNHVHYTAFDPEPTPASLSENIIKHYLRDELGYKGVVVSDDMVMGGIKNNYKQCEACLKGIDAGIDLFVFRESSDEILNVIETIYDAVKDGKVSERRIDDSARRILLCKEKYGLLKPNSC